MKLKTKIFALLFILNYIVAMTGFLSFDLNWKPFGQICFLSFAILTIAAVINWLFFETKK